MLDLLESDLILESKRAIFTHGRVQDWFCSACDKPLDIKKREPMIIRAHVNGQQIARVIVCKPCLESSSEHSADAMRQRAKKAWFMDNPDRVDGDHVPFEAQLMIPGTRPDPSRVDHVTLEVI